MNRFVRHILIIAVVFFSGILAAQAATLSLTASSGQITVGQAVTVYLRVQPGGVSINSAEATVSFPTNLLQYSSVSLKGSVFSVWPVPASGSNSRGTVIFSGGVPRPGYSGSSGAVISMSFKGKAAGRAALSVSGGKVLANDGQGTNVLTGQGSTSINIVAPASTPTEPKPTPTPTPPVTPPAAPDRSTPTISPTPYTSPATWYRQEKTTMSWKNGAGALGVSFSLTNNPSTIPDDTFESAAGRTEITLPSDGQWYFHLRTKYASGWSATARYTLQHDATAPDAFVTTIELDRGASDPSPVVKFQATDPTSGIDHYTLAVDDQAAVEASSPHTLNGLAAGTHQVSVVAFDRAGNQRTSTQSFTLAGYPAPTITFVASPLLLLDDLIIKGTAQAGDIITIYLDQEKLGQATAGVITADADPQIRVQTPWAFVSDVLIRPGTHRVTATATSPSGQVSATTDPQDLVVSGKSLLFRGRPVATISMVPILSVLLIAILAGLGSVLLRLVLAFRSMHQRELVADADLHQLRARYRGRRMTTQQVDAALGRIEDELEGTTRKRSGGPAAKS